MEDRCVICGEIIPEGRHVCLGCEDAIPHRKSLTISGNETV